MLSLENRSIHYWYEVEIQYYWYIKILAGTRASRGPR